MPKFFILSITIINLIAGCGEQDKPISPTTTVLRSYKEDTVLEGAVANNVGVIKSGSIVATSEQGKSITEAAIQDGHFQITIPAKTALPILLSYTAESGSDKFMTAVIYDTVTRYYINPTTTAIAKAAKAMGGYTRANLDRAAESVVSVPESNKTSAGWRGDPTKQYGGWH